MTPSELQQYDRSNMFDLIRTMPEQIGTAWSNACATKLPARRDIDNILVTGMGGSAIGGDLMAGLFYDSLPIALVVNRDYSLPAFVNERTLVIACSYSGDTEETVTALQAALAKKALVVCISSNGALQALAQKNKCGFIKVAGGQPPRTALAHLFFAKLAVLQFYGIIPNQEQAVAEAVQVVTSLGAIYADYTNAENPALVLANRLVGRIPIIYGLAEPNAALPLRWRNQLSENAKVLAFANLLPEMNHNDIVGWGAASDLLNQAMVIFLADEQNLARNQARLNITRQIIAKQAAATITILPTGILRLARTFSLSLHADYTSYYLAILNKVDPTDINSIDFLKRELAEL